MRYKIRLAGQRLGDDPAQACMGMDHAVSARCDHEVVLHAGNLHQQHIPALNRALDRGKAARCSTAEPALDRPVAQSVADRGNRTTANGGKACMNQPDAVQPARRIASMWSKVDTDQFFCRPRERRAVRLGHSASTDHCLAERAHPENCEH